MKPSYEDLENLLRKECKEVEDLEKLLAAKDEALRECAQEVCSCLTEQCIGRCGSAKAREALSLTKDSLAGMRLVKSERLEALEEIFDAASACFNRESPGVLYPAFVTILQEKINAIWAARQSGGESSKEA